MSLRAPPEVLRRAISRMVSTDSCFAVSMKLQVLTTRISASSGRAVRRAPAWSRRPIMTSESTRFLGQPNEIKPTVGAVGGESLLTPSFYQVHFFPVLGEIPAPARTPLASAEYGPFGSSSRYFW